MKILIHGKNLELTGALKEYTKAKIGKATHHYKDIVKEADIHLSVEKNPRVSFQTAEVTIFANGTICLLYTSPSPRDRQKSRMPSSA